MLPLEAGAIVEGIAAAETAARQLSDAAARLTHMLHCVEVMWLRQRPVPCDSNHWRKNDERSDCE